MTVSNPILFSHEQRHALLAAWPEAAAGTAEKMLQLLALGIAEVRSLRDGGNLQPTMIASERSKQWLAVAKAADDLRAATSALSEEAFDDAVEHEAGCDHTGRDITEIYAECRHRVWSWKQQAQEISGFSNRWAQWSAGKRDEDHRRHRPRDAEAWAISEKAALAWLDLSGHKLSVSTWLDRNGDRAYSPSMRFILAVLHAAEVGTEGSGIARAVCEEILELLPDSKAPTRRKKTMR